MARLSLDKKLARLESTNDQLSAEISYINELLKSVGFPEGIHSAKEIARELIETEALNKCHKPKNKN